LRFLDDCRTVVGGATAADGVVKVLPLLRALLLPDFGAAATGVLDLTLATWFSIASSTVAFTAASWKERKQFFFKMN
jgi:hypothetical protein